MADAEHVVDHAMEHEIEDYTAIDPVTTTTHPWELEVHSRTLTIISWIMMLLAALVHIFMALVVGVEDTGAAVTSVDKWAFIGIGIIVVAVFWNIRRPRVRANSDGVEVRNFIGVRFYPWSLVYGLSFPKKSPCAHLELPEFEFVPMWAFMARDGEYVLNAVTHFRELEARYMPDDSDEDALNTSADRDVAS